MKIRSGQYPEEKNWQKYLKFNTGPQVNRIVLYRAAAYIRDTVGKLCVVDVGLRTMKAQQEAYERWKAGQGPLAALPGESRHNFGLALDFNNIGIVNGVKQYPGTLNKDYDLWKSKKPETLNKYGLQHRVDGERWHIEPVEANNVSVQDIAFWFDEDDYVNTASGYPRLELTEPYTIGTFVRHLQELLETDNDGTFGPLTDKAAREYQTANGLTVDGIVADETWYDLTKPNVELPTPCKSCLALEKENALLEADVRELQHALKVEQDRNAILADKHRAEIDRINVSHAQTLTELTKQRDVAVKEMNDTTIMLNEATAMLSKIRSSWNEFISFLLP